jgi:hypothetical protein
LDARHNGVTRGPTRAFPYVHLVAHRTINGNCAGHAWLRVQYTNGTYSVELHSAGKVEVYGSILHAWHKSQSGPAKPGSSRTDDIGHALRPAPPAGEATFI